MICRNLAITIKEDKAELSEKLFVYQNDRGIHLHFTVKDNKLIFGQAHDNSSLLASIENGYARATVLKPDGKEAFKTQKAPIVNDIIDFTITQEMTDELTEIGIYTLQFHLYDSGNNRGTIPPITFTVKELIANVPDDLEGQEVATVGHSKVDECIVANETTIIEIIDGRAYAKTNWATGDLITAEKLNKIEAKLEELDQRESGQGITCDKVFFDDSKTFSDYSFKIGITISQIEGYIVQTIRTDGKYGNTVQHRYKLDDINIKESRVFLYDTTWSQWSNYKGNDGSDGKSVELQKTSTHIQWRQAGGVWSNLISLNDIKGLDGITPIFNTNVNVTTGNPGTNASASVNEVSPNNYQISLTIPRGNNGSPGAKGDSGVRIVTEMTLRVQPNTVAATSLGRILLEGEKLKIWDLEYGLQLLSRNYIIGSTKNEVTFPNINRLVDYFVQIVKEERM